MKKTITAGFIMASFMIMAISCGKYPGFKKTDSGIYYKFHEKNAEGRVPDTGNILTLSIQYRAKVDGKDTVYFNSKDIVKPFELPLNKPQFPGDIYEALSMMKQGDSATFILNAVGFFTKTAHYPMLPPGLDSTSKIYFDIKLREVNTIEEREKAKAEKAAKQKSEESVILKEYIARKNISVQPTASGIYIVEKQPGSGRLIAKGDFVEMHFTVSRTNDTVIFTTHKSNRPITFEYGKPFDTEGFDEVIGTLRKGSHVVAVVPSAKGYGERGRLDMAGNEIIAPFSTIIYEIEILNVETKAQHDAKVKAEEAAQNKKAEAAKNNEAGLIQKYLKENKINVQPLASGLYYIEKTKGTGPKAASGQKVSVHYTGKLLNGKVFDSSLERKPSKPYEFTLGRSEVIKGWDEGIAMMSKGGKATLIIPSKLAYGERGAGNDIGPYEPLVFDVELVDIKTK